MSSTPALAGQAGTSRLQVASRVAAAVVGGYGFAWGVVALGAVAFFASGMDFHDAEFLAGLIGILAYLCVFLWAVATPRLGRCWLLLLGAGAVMTAAASALQAVLA